MGGRAHARTCEYRGDDDASLATDIHGTAARPIMTDARDRNDVDGDVQWRRAVR